MEADNDFNLHGKGDEGGGLRTPANASRDGIEGLEGEGSADVLPRFGDVMARQDKKARQSMIYEKITKDPTYDLVNLEEDIEKER